MALGRKQGADSLYMHLYKERHAWYREVKLAGGGGCCCCCC